MTGAALGRRERLGGIGPEMALAFVLLAVPFVFPRIGGTLDTANRILDWGLFGLGFDLLFGFTGLLSFGQAAFFGSGGFVAAWLLTAGATANALVALAAGTVAAALFGVVIGILSLRRTGIYFAMLTLAFGEMFYFLDISPLARWTGGENGIAGVPTPHLGFGPLALELKTPSAIYTLIAIIFVLGYWLAHCIVRSPLGAVLRAVRENEARAAAVGHDVSLYKLTAFIIAAAYAGLAGGLLGLLQGYMPPDAFYLDTSGQLVVQTVIGGAGTLVGPLVGATLWLYLYTVLQQVAGIGALWKLFLGVIFVVLVTALRRGIWGGGVLLWQLVRRDRALAVAAVLGATSVATVADAPRPRATLSGASVLSTRGLTKRYGGLTAVDGVDFELVAGEIRAVIGPNGAGKSTFFNMLAGTVPPSGGQIVYDGEDVTGLGATLVCQRGLAKSFQINQLFAGLTVRENVLVPTLARHYGKFTPAMLRRVAHIGALNDGVAMTLAAVQLEGRADAPVNALAYGEKRRLEIALALATRPKVLLLDEPTAGMSPAERIDTVRLLKRIAAGVTIVIVEHDMDVVFGLADRITVLFNGRKIAEGSPEAIQADPAVRAAYLGTPVAP